jgi:hypothetical protein
MRLSRPAFWILCPLLACSAVLLAFQQAGKTRGDSPQKGVPVTNQPEPLPFNLTKSTLPEVELLYGFYSSKTGAGKQEITILGSGKVKLLLTRSFSSPPEIREGAVSTDLVVRLLDMIAGENFLTLNDHYPAHDAPHARRIIRLSLPDVTKTVIVDEPVCPEFERVAGAAKLLSGIALPEALGQRFFPNL